MQLLKSHTDWRRTWTLIVPGHFDVHGAKTDLLFYDRNAGQGEFYSTYLGNISLLKTHTLWRTTWSLIVPGVFSAGPTTSLLFYDQGAGVGEFYSTDGVGGITLLRSYGDWRNSWTHIAPGNFGGRQTDLLFYDTNSGDLELYQVEGNGNLTDGQGNYAPWRAYPGWGAGWTHVVPGLFGLSPAANPYTSFLFYNAVTGEARFYTSDGSGNLTLLRDEAWNADHTYIVPGMFGGSETDLLFYDAATNAISVFFEYQGYLLTLGVGDVPVGIWNHIIPGTYSDWGYSDLLFYDVDSGIGSFYRSETPVEWQTGLVQAYAGETSVFPGDVLPFHVSSRTGNCALDISRSGGDRSVLFHAVGTAALLSVADDAYQAGCGWPSAYNLAVPGDWQSGLYIARISTTDGNNNDTKDIPFVVRAPLGRQAKILCVLPFATIQAYNRWGGRGLYGHAVDNDSEGGFIWGSPRAFKASFDRPTLYAVDGDDLTLTDVNFRWAPFILWF